MVSFFIFSAPLLVIRGVSPSIRAGQRKRRGRSNYKSTRRTVSVSTIRPSPLSRGLPPSPAAPFLAASAPEVMRQALAVVRERARLSLMPQHRHGRARRTAVRFMMRGRRAGVGESSSGGGAEVCGGRGRTRRSRPVAKRHRLGRADVVDVGCGDGVIDRAPEVGIIDDMRSSRRKRRSRSAPIPLRPRRA